MFKLRKLKKMCEQLNPQRIKAAFESGDEDNAMRLMRIQMKMKEAYDTIAKRRNIVVLP